MGCGQGPHWTSHGPLSLWVPPGTQWATQSEPSIAVGNTVTQGLYPSPKLFERPRAEWGWPEGHRDKGPKSPGTEGLAQALAPGMFSETLVGSLSGQWREGSRGKHPPADTVDKALWRTCGGHGVGVGQQTERYTKAPKPSSGSSPGRPAPWLFHMHVSHASSLSPASAASSTPGEEGDKVRHGHD